MSELKQGHIITKPISQIITILIEVGGVGFLTAFLCNYISPTEDYVEHIERFLIGSSVYELFLFCTLTQLNDIQKDSFLSLLTGYKYAELYCETKDDKLCKILQKMLEAQLGNGIFNSIQARGEYRLLQSCIDNEDLTTIKAKIVHYEHCYEYCSLQWRYSILLRLRK